MGLSLGNAVSLKLARFIISSKAFGGNGESLGKSADRARAASSPQATYPNEPNSREGIKTEQGIPLVLVLDLLAIRMNPIPVRELRPTVAYSHGCSRLFPQSE